MFIILYSVLYSSRSFYWIRLTWVERLVSRWSGGWERMGGRRWRASWWTDWLTYFSASAVKVRAFTVLSVGTHNTNHSKETERCFSWFCRHDFPSHLWWPEESTCVTLNLKGGNDRCGNKTKCSPQTTVILTTLMTVVLEVSDPRILRIAATMQTPDIDRQP